MSQFNRPQSPDLRPVHFKITRYKTRCGYRLRERYGLRVTDDRMLVTCIRCTPKSRRKAISKPLAPLA